MKRRIRNERGTTGFGPGSSRPSREREHDINYLPDDDDAPVVKYVPPTFDEYLKSDEFLKFAHDLNEAIKQYDLTHDIKFDDDGPRDNVYDWADEYQYVADDIIDLHDGAKHHYIKSSDSYEYYCLDCSEYFPDPDEHERGN